MSSASPATFDFRIGSLHAIQCRAVFNTTVAETSTITMPMESEEFSQHLLDGDESIPPHQSDVLVWAMKVVVPVKLLKRIVPVQGISLGRQISKVAAMHER